MYTSTVLDNSLRSESRKQNYDERCALDKDREKNGTAYCICVAIVVNQKSTGREKESNTMRRNEQQHRNEMKNYILK